MTQYQLWICHAINTRWELVGFFASVDEAKNARDLAYICNDRYVGTRIVQVTIAT